MNSVIIIPTLKPDDKIIRLVKDLKKEEFDKIVVVDDGSGKDYSSIFESLEKLGCKVTHHEVNKGKGEGIKTGIKFANKEFKDFVGYITVDGDYQHLPCDVKKVALKMEEDDTKIVLGERNFKEKNVPPKSKIGNGFSTLFFRLQTGVYVEDTQTGLRGIPFRYRKFALGIEGSRYEYEMNFLREAAEGGIKFEMVRIETVYEDNNKGSHFRPLRDAALIYKELIRFSIISILSAIIDVALFAVLIKIFTKFDIDVFDALVTSFALSKTTVITATSNIAARIVSGVFNFSMNRKVAFKSTGNSSKQALKYIILFLIQMGVSTLLVSLCSHLPVNLTAMKIVIDVIIFFVNYFIEKRFIFKKKVIE